MFFSVNFSWNISESSYTTSRVTYEMLHIDFRFCYLCWFSEMSYVQFHSLDKNLAAFGFAQEINTHEYTHWIQGTHRTFGKAHNLCFFLFFLNPSQTSHKSIYCARTHTQLVKLTSAWSTNQATSTATWVGRSHHVWLPGPHRTPNKLIHACAYDLITAFVPYIHSTKLTSHDIYIAYKLCWTHLYYGAHCRSFY
jgi:hypothetical protein